MIDYLKSNHLSLLIILFLVVSHFMGGGADLFSAARADLTTVGNPWTFTNSSSNGGVTLASTTITSSKTGQAGTKITGIVSGTCNLDTSGTASFSATSTLIGYCSATGVAASDRCLISAPNARADGALSMNNNGVFLTGFAIATTSNQIGVQLINLGAATTSFIQATSSVGYWCVR